MRRLLGVLIGVGLVVGWGCQSQSAVARVGMTEDGLKVFISVDMEGIAGVTAGSDVSSSGPDYQYFHTYDLGSECCCGGSSGGRRNRDRG